jgi:dTDP-glucose 4,6-dehydratase
MKRILVTGVAGFIGSRLAEMILTSEEAQLNDCTIIGLDALRYSGREENLSNLKTQKRFTFIHGDIADQKLVSNIYSTHEIDATINVAAESHVDNSIKNPSLFVKTNTLGTSVLLQNHQQHSAGRFLQVSTDEVYGSISIGKWTEDFPLAPRSPYSASKAAADLITLSFARTFGIDVVVTRCCNNYGPRQFPEKIIPLFITNLIRGKTIPIYGNGENRREWIHVEDHCRGILRVIELSSAANL